MKILVTGGLGFIGSHFIRYLLRHHPQYRILNLDKCTYAANAPRLRDITPGKRYRFYRGDVRNATLVGKLLRQSDAVVHCAAETHVDRSIIRTDEFLRTNIEGTAVLLQAARERRIRRFLHLSTDEVYGSRARGSFREDAPLNPNSPYAASKAAADLLIRAFRVTFGYPIIVARPCNNFGAAQFPEKFIPLFISNALDNQPLPLYGSGKNVRSWLFVEDTCRALDSLLHRGVPGEIYNISGGEEYSNHTVARMILRLLHKPTSLVVSVADRPGHDLRYALDSRKVRATGWRPRYSFQQGLAVTVRWYRDHRSWWEGLKQRPSFRRYYESNYGRRQQKKL